MNWIVVAITGHLLNATAFIVDKTLLSNAFKRSGTFATIIGVSSAFVFVLFPKLSARPDAFTWFTIAAFGALFVIATWGFFEALSRAETSRVVPVIGSLIPIFTLIMVAPLVHETLTGRALFGFILLVISTVLLTRGGAKKHRLDRPTLWICVGSAFLFAASTAFGKYSFEHAPFIDVFLWSRLFAALTGLSIPLLSPAVRAELRSLVSRKDEGKWKKHHSIGFMLFGQTCGALGFIGVQYAVSLGSATVVSALQAVQYAAIVLVAWIGGPKFATLLKEERTASALRHKGFAILLVAIGLMFVSWTPAPVHTRYGFSWSMPYAYELGLDGKAGFARALNELHPEHVRLMAYWDQIEKQQGNFDFTELDWQLDAAERAGVPVTLAVGARLPRWPECWIPAWVMELPANQRDDQQLTFLKTVYQHEQQRGGIESWQIENEAQLTSFQTCPGLTKELVSQELQWVRGEEQKRGQPRPVGTTDSGELSSWLHFAGQTDQLGISVYRVVTNPLFGTVPWILPADYYSDKAALVSHWTGKIYVSEFQMEPWFNQSLTTTPIADQISQFNTQRMQKNFDYASRLEMPVVDFWGVEWWLWMQEKQNHPEYWEMAKTFFAK
jgi:drug/metabolite transporter (DMT)-like permease